MNKAQLKTLIKQQIQQQMQQYKMYASRFSTISKHYALKIVSQLKYITQRKLQVSISYQQDLIQIVINQDASIDWLSYINTKYKNGYHPYVEIYNNYIQYQSIFEQGDMVIKSIEDIDNVVKKWYSKCIRDLANIRQDLENNE